MLPRLSTLSIPYEVDVTIPQYETMQARVLNEGDVADLSEKVVTCALCLATVHPGKLRSCDVFHTVLRSHKYKSSNKCIIGCFTSVRITLIHVRVLWIGRDATIIIAMAVSAVHIRPEIRGE